LATFLEQLEEFAETADSNKVKEFAGALKDAAKRTLELRGALAAITISQAAFNKVLPQAKQALDDIQQTQVDFTKTLGVDGVDAANRSIEAFKEFNTVAKSFGLTLSEVNQAVKNFDASLKFTPASAKLSEQAFESLEKRIASNSKVIDESKLVQFTKDFSLASEVGTTRAEMFGEQLVQTAIKAGLPREALLNLSQDLLRTGVVFGSSIKDIQELTFRTEAFGRALGTTGDAIKGQLGDMMTIGQRQQLAARLSQIGTMVGARVDVAKLMSGDPAVQQEAIQDTLRSFSQQYQQLESPEQKRALFIALSRTLRLPAQAVQNALQSGVDIDKAVTEINKARAKADKGIDDATRRQFRTLTEAITGLQKQLELSTGQAQINALNKGVAALVDNASKQTNTIKQFDENMMKYTNTMAEVGKASADAVLKLAGALGGDIASKAVSAGKKLLKNISKG
jgi:hypothetical protein